MVRTTPTAFQNFLSSVILPLLTLPLLPISFVAVIICIFRNNVKFGSENTRGDGDVKMSKGNEQGCVIISGGRMTKGLT